MFQINSLHRDLIEKIKLTLIFFESIFCAVVLICVKICAKTFEHFLVKEKAKMLKQSLGHPTIFQRIDRPMSALQSLMSSDSEPDEVKFILNSVVKT